MPSFSSFASMCTPLRSMHGTARLLRVLDSIMLKEVSKKKPAQFCNLQKVRCAILLLPAASLPALVESVMNQQAVFSSVFDTLVSDPVTLSSGVY
jgi:hypothetical protein